MTPIRSWSRAGLLALLLTSAFVTAAPAEPWQGREEVREGILHVLNPANPMEPHRTIRPRELWRLGGESEADEELFGRVEQIRVDPDGNVYILDVQLNEIRVFGPDGGYLRTIGRDGEGPGDFRNPSDFFMLPDGRVGVTQMMPARISMMRTDGEGLSDMPLPEGQDGALMFMVERAEVSPGFLVFARTVMNFDDEGQHSQSGLLACDHEGNVVSLWKNRSRTRKESGTVHIAPDAEISYTRFWDLGMDDRCFLAPWYSAYRIEVLDGTGRTERIIEREYESIARTDDEIKAIEARYSDLSFSDRKLVLDINPMRRDIASIRVRPDGELWVLSSEGEDAREENTLGVFDVFDAEGRFARTLSIEVPCDPDYDEVIIRGDRLFLLREVNNGQRVMNSQTAAGTATMIMAGDAGADEDREADPFEIICYALED